MKKVKVKHLTREAFRNASCIFDDNKRMKFIKNLDQDDFVTVLETTFGDDITLDYIYHVTNSANHLWTDIFSNAQLPQGRKIRSTSPGDLVVIDDATYMVASFGFKRLKNYQLSSSSSEA